MKKATWLNIIFFLIPFISVGQNHDLVIGQDSQLNCIDFNPDFYLQDTKNSPGGAYWIAFDLNNDAIADLRFIVTAFSAPMSPITSSADIILSDSNLQVACDTQFYAWPDTLAMGDTLKNKMRDNVWTSLIQWPQYSFNLRYLIYGNGGLGGTGLWQDYSSHYLGFRFIINTDTLYGYFELEVRVGIGSAQLWIDKFCYEGTFNTVTGIDDIIDPDFDLLLSPNPALSRLRITCSSRQEYFGSLIDAYGRNLNSFSFTGDYETDVSRLSPGIYFVVLHDNHNKKITTRKFAKE